MGSEVEIWRMGSLLDVFMCLLFSSLLLFFGYRPGTNGINTGLYPLSMVLQFRCALGQPKSGHWAVPISSGIYDFVQVHTWQQCVMLPSYSFPFLLYSLCNPGGLRLKRGIIFWRHMTPDWVTAILYSQLATRLWSLAITLPICLFAITCIHDCDGIPKITICMPLRPNPGICALAISCIIDWIIYSTLYLIDYYRIC